MTGPSKGFDTPADLLFCNFDYHNAILNYSISVKNQVYMCYDNVNILVCRSGHTFRFSLDQGFFFMMRTDCINQMRFHDDVTYNY